MATEQLRAGIDYQAAAGPEIQGVARDPEAVSVAELVAEPPTSTRPVWAVTRYPVDMEEFARLNAAANEPDPESLAAFADPAPDSDEAAEILDLPEDGGPSATGPGAQAPATGASFAGIPQTAWRPPDPTCAVGPDHVLVAANVELRGYSKTGTLLFIWPNITHLFASVLPAGAGLFDPRLAYDHYANRWIVVIDARRSSPAGSWIMLAVSQTANPLGPWWTWALDARLDGSTLTSNWADYSALGFDTQGIYISSNMFAIGGSGGFQYTKLRILKKSQVYAGGAIQWYDFWNLKNPDGSLAFTVQPCVHFRGLGGNPPAYLVNALWPSGSTLTLWTLTNPVGFWTGGTPSLARTGVACRAYNLPPDAQQRGSSTPIETNDARLLNAVFQHAGGVQRVWTTQTSKHTWSGDSAARSVVQWYEIDVPGKNVVQQNAYGAAGKYYFFPAIQTDIGRNAHVAFGRSSSTEFGELRQTGRLVGAPLGDLQGSALVKIGLSPYTGERWGDYFGICRDPADTLRVWGYGEFAAASGNWGTWVYSAKF